MIRTYVVPRDNICPDQRSKHRSDRLFCLSFSVRSVVFLSVGAGRTYVWKVGVTHFFASGKGGYPVYAFAAPPVNLPPRRNRVAGTFATNGRSYRILKNEGIMRSVIGNSESGTSGVTSPGRRCTGLAAKRHGERVEESTAGKRRLAGSASEQPIVSTRRTTGNKPRMPEKAAAISKSSISQ